MQELANSLKRQRFVQNVYAEPATGKLSFTLRGVTPQHLNRWVHVNSDNKYVSSSAPSIKRRLFHAAANRYGIPLHAGEYYENPPDDYPGKYVAEPYDIPSNVEKFPPRETPYIRMEMTPSNSGLRVELKFSDRSEETQLPPASFATVAPRSIVISKDNLSPTVRSSLVKFFAELARKGEK